jgi:hypothetical protein
MKKYKSILIEIIKPKDMMTDCDYFRNSHNCTAGQYQKEYCNKDCPYYNTELKKGE